jgi:RHS repeat-associated protein
MTNTPPTATNAKVVWRAMYDPYGNATEVLDPDGDGKSFRMPFRFPGQWWDFATGLHYNFFRDYDPATGRYLEADPETHQIEGVSVRITSAAKTVTDCFKYRNKIGLDVALEALRDAWRERRITMDEIDRYARVCRVQRVIRPYLEMLCVS